MSEEMLYADIFIDKEYDRSDHWPVLFTIHVPSILQLQKLKDMGKENFSTKYWTLSKEIEELN